ncbi:MAG TPA: hypothetical protein ENN98_02255 [Desulfurivibrio alkaliphilus]|uniref:Uncharacterized protein n=1 Tax=Desulfurivibrio alkaliphilus TaxID=427923 RepID=A0A7C2TIY7_9BACT|nr:hypothetical protein [Desulfurivibrio alkaliphilus]
MANVQVEARGVTFQSSTYATTGSDGRACMTVKRSEDENEPERITVHGRLGSFSRTYKVTDAAEGDETSNEIYVPTADGSTIRNTNPENWLLLGNKLVMAYDGRIQGSVSYEDSGSPAVGIRVRTNLGVTAITDAAGNYELKVPQGTVLVAVVGAPSQEVAVGESPATADFIIPNQAPVIDDLQANPGLVVDAGTLVAFQAVAHDPDGYLLDQDPADAPYTVTVDRLPARLDWIADSALYGLYIYGWRGNAEVGLNRYYGLPADMGTLTWAAAFPADSYSIKAEGRMGEDGNDWRTVLNQSAVPASLHIPVAGFNLADLSYHLDDKRFTWQLQGEADAVDYVEVVVYAYEWSWTAAMAPAASGVWSVPDLPQEIADWVDFTVPPHDAGIEAGDFDAVSGYDHLVATYTFRGITRN